MDKINIKKEVKGSFDDVIQKVTAALQSEGFGVLTRIDFHAKIKEKIGKDVPPTVILGACNPQLAYQAFNLNPDVTSLMPCNAVVRQIQNGTNSVELVKAGGMVEMMGDKNLADFAREVDKRLATVLEKIH